MPMILPRTKIRALRALAFAAAALLGPLALGGAGCEEEPGEGTARLAYTLTDPAGEPLTCEAAGVEALTVELFTAVGDETAAHVATVDCDVGADGEGTLTAEFPVGLYEQSVVTLLDATGDAAVQPSGAPARWEYLSIEIAGGVPTDFLPPVSGVFEADVE